MEHTEPTPRKQLVYSTVRIEAQLPGGKSAFGTGFIVKLTCRDKPEIDLLVTNRHVIDGAMGWSVNMSSMINGKIERSRMAGETVLMIGYLNGLWDEIHNFPLFRQ